MRFQAGASERGVFVEAASSRIAASIKQIQQSDHRLCEPIGVKEKNNPHTYV